MENETNLSTIDNLEKTLIEKFVKTCILCRGSGLPVPYCKNDEELKKILWSDNSETGCLCGHCGYWFDLL